MNIAILGWGSLIWCQGGLRIKTRLACRRSLVADRVRENLTGRPADPCDPAWFSRAVHVLGRQRVYGPQRRPAESQDARENKVQRDSSCPPRWH
jgi:hypothetical protein